MFFNRDRGPTIEEKLTRLSAEEQIELAKFERLLNSPTEQIKASISQEIKWESREKMYRFYENSKKNKGEFYKFCHLTNSLHESEWSEILKEAKFPYINIRSLTGDEDVSIIQLYIGSYLHKQFLSDSTSENGEAKLTNEEKLYCIDKACELGVFEALSSRARICCDKIKNDNLDERERTIAFGQLMVDTKRISNLYGIIGYFDSAKIFLELGNYYQSKKEDFANFYHDTAARNYFCGKILLLREDSNCMLLLNIITKNQPFQTLGYASLAAAEKDFLADIKKSAADLYTEATEQIANSVKQLAARQNTKTN